MRAFRFPFTSIALSGLLLVSTLAPGGQAGAEEGYAISEVPGIVATGERAFASLTNVFPAALNDAGVVVANASDGGVATCCGGVTAVPGERIVAITSGGGVVRRIGRSSNVSLVSDVNGEGIAVGFETALDDDLADGRAVVWSGGEIERLPSLGGDFAFALGINTLGHVVGVSRLERGGTVLRATVWRSGEATQLGTLGGESSIAHDINDGGVIAGAAIATAVRYQPVLWVEDSIVALPLPRFWVAGEALAVNEAGVAVGGGFLEFSEAPMRWDDGGFTELPGFAERVTGVARDINEAGVIVGQVYVSNRDYSGYVAVRWDAGGVVDLNSLIPAGSGYVLIDAVSINDRGQILVTAVRDGVTSALVLTPARS